MSLSTSGRTPASQQRQSDIQPVQTKEVEPVTTASIMYLLFCLLLLDILFNKSYLQGRMKCSEQACKPVLLFLKLINLATVATQTTYLCHQTSAHSFFFITAEEVK